MKGYPVRVPRFMQLDFNEKIGDASCKENHIGYLISCLCVILTETSCFNKRGFLTRPTMVDSIKII